MSIHHIPEPSQIDYHADLQVRRTERALHRIDPGDVLAIIDARIASEADSRKHPLYHLVVWHMDKCLIPLDGGEFFDRWRTLVIEAIDRCLDEQLARGDD